MKLLPKQVLTSLTWDRGREMCAHEAFTMATDKAVYLCDPSSPWQRGSNDNTNRLLLQYFPKGKGMAIYTQSQLDEVDTKLILGLEKLCDLELQLRYFKKRCIDHLNQPPCKKGRLFCKSNPLKIEVMKLGMLLAEIPANTCFRI